MVDDDLRHLGQLLWRSRACLEQVEYLLDVQHLLAESGMERWLGRAADQLAQASAELGALDQERAEVLFRLSVSLGRSGPLLLSDLVEHVPEPWNDIYADHLRWFTSAVARIGEASSRARASVAEGLSGVQELLRSLQGVSGSGYDHSGRAVTATAGTALFFDDRA